MGAPLPDLPQPAQVVQASAGFDDTKPAASLCGFKIPLPYIKFALNLPGFKLPPFPPKIRLSRGINCNLSNPLAVSAGVDFGGGRQGFRDPSPDDDQEV